MQERTIIPERFKGKVAIVTGASKMGIGRACAHRLAAEGASVVLNARHADELERTVAAFRAEGLAVTSVVGDITQTGTAHQLVKAAISTFGRIDLLVNNVGLNGSAGRAHHIQREQYSGAVIGNSWIVIEMVQEAMKAGLSDGGGAVVNISSIVARKLMPYTVSYAVGKGALEGVTKALALDLAPEGVRVNAVAPGMTKSEGARPMWEPNEARNAKVVPLGRLGEPQDIAAAVTFLLSDDAAWITGQILDVDGGAILSPMGFSME